MKGRNMSLGKNTHRLGGLTKDNIDFPKHLTPEIIHTALFIYNLWCPLSFPLSKVIQVMT